RGIYMLRKSIPILLVLVLAASLMVACGSDGDKPAGGGGKEQFIAIATGGTGGVYYPLGGALQEVYNDNLDNVTANSSSTGASVENIGLIEDGDADIAFIQNDITYYASEGIEMFEEKGKVDGLSGMAIWYPEVVQVVANASAGIESIEDLAGKKVAVGDAGSGTEANARQILEAHGLNYDDLGKADYLSFSEASDQLQDGHVDAAFVTAGLP